MHAVAHFGAQALGVSQLSNGASNFHRRTSSLAATSSGHAARLAGQQCFRTRRSRIRIAAKKLDPSDDVASTANDNDSFWLDAIKESEGGGGVEPADDDFQDADAPRGPKKWWDMEEGPESAYLVGFELKGDRDRLFSMEESLDELQRLAETAGLQVAGRTSQRSQAMDGRTLVGSGKVEQILQECAAMKIETIIFDCELTPRQGRNIEQLASSLPGGAKIRVCDRTALILDIFAQRAQTKEGKLQVALAQAEYQLPRLTRMWTHLDRVGGGGQVKGTGESQLQLDKRIIKDQVRMLREKLDAVRTHRSNYRQRRAATGIPVVALVGYTNAGKSTLLNRLAGADVLAEDKLFATLDPTSRRVVLPKGKDILFTDTVGFIQALPTQLVASFRATLEEVQEASLILHVVDASHPNWASQMAAVHNVLEEMDVLRNIPMVTAFNKIDAVEDPAALARAAASAGALDASASSAPATPAGAPPPPRRAPFGKGKGGAAAAAPGRVACISAHTGEGIDALLALIEERVSESLCVVEAVLPFSEGALVAEARRVGFVDEERFLERGVAVRAHVPLSLVRRFDEFRVSAEEWEGIVAVAQGAEQQAR